MSDDLQTHFTVNDGTASLECAKGVTVNKDKPNEAWISLEVRGQPEVKMPLDEVPALARCLMYYSELDQQP